MRLSWGRDFHLPDANVCSLEQKLWSALVTDTQPPLIKATCSLPALRYSHLYTYFKLWARCENVQTPLLLRSFTPLRISKSGLVIRHMPESGSLSRSCFSSFRSLFAAAVKCLLTVKFTIIKKKKNNRTCKHIKTRGSILQIKNFLKKFSLLEMIGKSIMFDDGHCSRFGCHFEWQSMNINWNVVGFKSKEHNLLNYKHQKQKLI